MIPNSSGHTHCHHQPALLAPPIDDWQKLDVVGDHVPATPSGHVEILVQHRLANVL